MINECHTAFMSTSKMQKIYNSKNFHQSLSSINLSNRSEGGAGALSLCSELFESFSNTLRGVQLCRQRGASD